MPPENTSNERVQPLKDRELAVSEAASGTTSNGQVYALPNQARAYKSTPEFNEKTVPRGLLRDHATKADVWGRIVIHSGRLLYEIDGVSHILEPGIDGVVPPEILHRIEPLGEVRFHVEFMRDGSEAPCER